MKIEVGDIVQFPNSTQRLINAYLESNVGWTEEMDEQCGMWGLVISDTPFYKDAVQVIPLFPIQHSGTFMWRKQDLKLIKKGEAHEDK